MTIAFKIQRGVLLFVFPLVAAGCRSSTNAVDKPAILKQIRQIAKEDSQSYERLLAHASPMAQEACKDKEWGVLECALKSSGFEPVIVSERASYAEYRCVLLPNAVTTKGGVAMALYVQFGISGGRSQPTVKGCVTL